MKTAIRSLVLIASFFLIGTAAAGLLDGTAREVQAVPTRQTAAKGAESLEDVLTFSRGRVSSRELKRSGIGPVPYTAQGTKDFLNWETAPILRARNKAQWEGVIKEQDITGTLKWITRDGRELYYFINGQKR